MEGKAEISTDNLGSIICKKVGTSESPKIVLDGHMDEVGFMVRSITPEGFVRFQTLGGWWNQVMLAQRVTIETIKGQVPGLIGSKPPHILTAEERNKVVEKDDMFIDVGAKDEADARGMGIRPGDPIIPEFPFTIMANPDYLLAKAWDNRVGCALFMDVIEALQGEKHPNTLYGVGAVQEEVGLRGAQTSAQKIQPDIGIALEVGIAGDMPGVKATQANIKLGKGPVVLLYDASLIPHRGLRDLVVDTAAEMHIDIQFDLMPGGGTDAGRIHVVGAGAPSICIAVPCRYIHSHGGIISRKDYEATRDLVVALVKKLDAKKVQELKEN
jgi:endoglucanase